MILGQVVKRHTLRNIDLNAEHLREKEFVPSQQQNFNVLPVRPPAHLII